MLVDLRSGCRQASDLSAALGCARDEKGGGIITDPYDPGVGMSQGLVDPNHQGTKNMLSLLWTILIGFIAGVIAKFVTPGDTHEPQGFILTTALGIVGALVATYLGQAVGWYEAGQGAGFIASIVGAVLILAVWGFIASRRT